MTWTCSRCTLENQASDATCVACSCAAPSAASGSASAAAAPADVGAQIRALESQASACDARVAEYDAAIRRASEQRDQAAEAAEGYRRKARTLQMHPEAAAVASSGGRSGGGDWGGSSFPWSETVQRCLRDDFGLAAFRQSQQKAINAAMARKDVFVIMPTGGGKSLLYVTHTALLCCDTHCMTTV